MLLTIAQMLGINVPRLIAYSLVAATVVIAGLTIRSHYINVGREQVTNEIAADNRETLRNVNSAKSKVEQCRIAGGRWDTSSGLCEQ